LAPAAASASASGRPTWPRPTIATVRPSSEVEPKTRSQATRIAASTPIAVHGLGSPEPPLSTASPDTWLVTSAIVRMSGSDVPTSSAVMYAPPSASTVSPKSSSTLRRSSPVGGLVPVGSAITPLPPPSGSPATADLNVIARDSRSASRIAARSSAYVHIRQPPSDGPRAVECTATIV
jgi:hypothetical protein